MAFSTQKDFFHVPFMNESVELGCKKACVKLKSYESTIDDRSWATDEAKQSKFLSDLVTCQYPSGHGEGDFRGLEDSIIDQNDNENLLETATNDPSTSQAAGKRRVDKYSKREATTAFDSKGNTLISSFGNLNTGDSLLQCANIHLADYQKLLKIKTTLEKELEVSNERLKTANQENKKIKEILTNKLDSNATKDFFNKIQKLTTNGKLNKNEENELLQIYQKMENMNKAYEILQAENNYLKRLIEKLNERVKLENITTQPEKSNDVSYLQKELNSVRKECILLRQIEEEYQRLKQHQTNKLPSISEQDAENIKAIIKERNSLREKCKLFKSLEQQVKDLERKAQEAHEVASELNSCLSNKSQHIDKMAGEMQNMQKYYEEQNQCASFREEALKAQLEELKDDLIKAKCQAQKADLLIMEVSSLRNEVLKRDLALNDYDCQYKQLMDVVNELQSVKLQCLQDNQSQTDKNQTDELAFYTCATLDEIMKELKRKGCFNDEFMAVYGLQPEPNDSNREYDDKQCCREMHRLQQQVNEMKNEMQEAANCEAICADALKRLKELETENEKLLQENQGLNVKLEEGEIKMSNMLRKIENLDKEINRNGVEAKRIGKDLEGTIGLVKDISDVQLKNQQLANAVSAINSRDDQKIIDDLRRQLGEEMEKLKTCQRENAKLQEEAEVREIDLKKLKELNNKLEADRIKLEAEYNIKLSNDKDNLNKRNDDKTKGEKSEHRIGKDIVHDENKGEKSEHRIVKDIVHDENKDLTVKDRTRKDIDNITDIKPPKSETDESENKTKNYDKIPISNENNNYDRDNLKTPSSHMKSSALDNNIKEDKVYPLKDTGKKQASSVPTKRSDLNEIKAAALVEHVKTSKSPSTKSTPLKDTTQQTTSHVPSKTTENIPPTSLDDNILTEAKSSIIKSTSYKQSNRIPPKAAALDNFVYQKSDTLKSNLLQGRSFEKELRNILEEFIHECGFCFSRLFNNKSKLYSICHKLYHSGINTLSFRELAYLHKKIYAQAEQMLPGCLLDMILSDHKEQVENMLMSSMVLPRLVGGAGTGNNDIDLKISNTNVTDMEQKCCRCKSELCCSNSEEMLKDKVNKLEKDIEIAREYLETLKNIPTLTTDNDDSTDTNNSTYRASPNVIISQKSRTSKHIKKLKARQIKSCNIQQ